MTDANPFLGLSAFTVTPVLSDGSVDTDRLGRIVGRLAATGVDAIGVMGSTGGYPYFSRAERRRAVSAAVEAAGGTPVIAGVGALRLDDASDCARDAERAGAEGLLLAPVSYLPLFQGEVVHLFETIAAATSRPICIYHNPTTTGCSLSEDTMAALSAIAGVDAIKNPAPPDGNFAAQMARLRDATRAGFTLGYSGDATIAGALGAGADSWYSVLAGTLPEPALRLWRARTDEGALAKENARFQPLWDLFAAYGGIRMVHHLTGTMLPEPMLPLPTDAQEAIEAAIDALGDEVVA